jgi:hypothetical protein
MPVSRALWQAETAQRYADERIPTVPPERRIYAAAGWKIQGPAG